MICIPVSLTNQYGNTIKEFVPHSESNWVTTILKMKGKAQAVLIRNDAWTWMLLNDEPRAKGKRWQLAGQLDLLWSTRSWPSLCLVSMWWCVSNVSQGLSSTANVGSLQGIELGNGFLVGFRIIWNTCTLNIASSHEICCWVGNVLIGCAVSVREPLSALDS